MTTVPALESTRLQPGQSLRMALDAGAALTITEGRVRIVAPPSWFGDTVFSVHNSFDEGEVYVAERGGWIEVVALTAARLRGVPRALPAAAAPVLGARVARLMQLLLPA